MTRQDAPIPIEQDESSEPGKLSLIGHDLQSAITDVISGLELVERDDLTGENRANFERALASSKTLARLLSGLKINIESVSVGLETEKSNFSLIGFLDDVSKRWTPKAAEQGLSFNLTKEETAPEFISTDRTVLERIMSNLLDNAIKYSDIGAIKLNVGLNQEQDLCFIVRDSGSGFSQEALDRLFEYRARPTNQRAAGTGMGLHIVKHLLDAMGGIVEVHNTERGGMVVVEIPYEQWALEPDTSPETLSYNLLENKRVLLAEDNPTSQLLLRRIIESLGAQVELATNGKVAMQLFEENQFDIALLDVEMPVMSGLEVIEEIRSRSDGRESTPIIAVTAYVMAEHRRRIMRAGANGTISKPVTSPDDFLHKVNSILSNHAPAKTPEVQTKDKNGRLTDPLVLSGLFDALGDEKYAELLTKVIDDLLSVQYRLSECFQSMDFSEIREQTHILISVAGAMGSTPVQAEAQALNRLATEEDTRILLSSLKQCINGLRGLVKEIKKELKERGHG